MTLDAVFLQILNMSITGSYVILVILLVRLVLKKAPKIFSYVLWSVAAFRLMFPISFSSVISLFSLKPFTVSSTQTNIGQALVYVPSHIGQMQTPIITSGIEPVDRIINEGLPVADAMASANPMQIWTLVVSGIWLAGFLIMLAYGIFSYARVRRLVSSAVRIDGNVYEADHIPTPFVLGFLKPRIFLPFHMPESERAYILRHERYHIRRGDHFIKPLSYLLLTVHWFNPLVWLAFHLMVRDMEMSCDELVLGQMGLSLKRDYSESLLALATRQRFPAASPLAFGESNARLRVRNVLRLRRPRTWIMIISLLLSLAVLLACAANPANSGNSTSQSGFLDGMSSRPSASLSSADIQALSKYDVKLATHEQVVQLKNQGYLDRFLARLDSEFNQKLNSDLDDKINQIQQWGMNPQTRVRDLESKAKLYLDSTVKNMQIGSPAFDQYVAASLSDSPSGIANLAKTDAAVGPIYLFLCVYQDYSETQVAGSVKYPFTEDFNNKSLEALFREDIARDFAGTDSLNILKSFVAEVELSSGVSLPTTRSTSSGFGADQDIGRTTNEIRITTDLILSLLDIPNIQIKAALVGMDPANPSAADLAMEGAIFGLAGGQLSDSQVNRAGTSFRNQIVDFHTWAVTKDFTIKPSSVKVTPNASQKSLYAYEAAALFSDEKESGKPITLIGRVQFDDNGKINFISLEGSDYHAIWARYAPK